MGHKKVTKKESFGQWFLDNLGKEKFDKLINHKKNIENGIDIFEISVRSGEELWFYCENKEYHEFKLTADKYFKGNRCKFCGRTKYVHPKDSLGQYIINNYGEDFLKKIWSDKNKNSPFDYTLGTERKIWTKCLCEKHEDTYRQVKNTIRSNFDCPQCVKESSTSKIENKTKGYLKSLGYEVYTEENCTLVPINPKTKRPLPYDNEIVLKNGKHLIIEVNGRQHYEELDNSSGWVKKETPKEYLHRRKLYDRYKRLYAKYMGYEYLEIPYTAFEGKNKNLYKELINNKIIEILK